MGGRTYFLGLILIVVLTAKEGSAESLFDDLEDQIASDSANTLSLSLPATKPAERRLSLEDFFLNRNNQQQPQQQQSAEQQVQQLPQFQVQQTDPNSVLLVRDSQFPSANGGLISRLLMARRMLRLRRWSRRLRMIPRLLGLGLQQPIRQASEPQPVVLLNNRVGRSYDDSYDPRDYVFGKKGYSYNNSLSSQENSYEREYERPRKNEYFSEDKPYYDTVHDLPYDLYEHSNAKPAKNYETEDLIEQNHQNNHNQAANAVDTGSHGTGHLQNPDSIQKIQQQLSYLHSLQQKQLPQLVHQQNNQNQNFAQHPVHTGQLQQHNTQSEKYNQNNDAYNNNNQHESHHSNKYNQNKQPIANPNHYEQLQNNDKYHQDSAVREQPHDTNLEQQLQLLREQQYQLAREQQLQLAREQQLKQLQQLQLLQQTQNYNQPQQPQHQQSNVVSNEQLYNYQQQSYQQQIQSPHSAAQQIQGESTENSRPLLSVDGTTLQSGTRAGSAGSSIGVGVNVGLLPPAIDIAVTKPVAPEIKPLPPIINPIGPKPIPVLPVQEQLVPLGFLPKPMLNLNGRLFFGAELGKGVSLGR